MSDTPPPSAPSADDPHAWLEEVAGERALTWVRAHNAATERALASSAAFQALEGRLVEILDSDARIPYVTKRGPHLYNFWRDGKNPQGLWRRTTMEEYRKAEPRWQTVLDVDALCAREGENWVWAGATVLRAGGYRHALVQLSRGGADATVVREFDLETLRFVEGEGENGFRLPEAKQRLSWIDRDQIYVGTDFGPGSLTSSGYPRLSKVWRRGTPLESATLVYEGAPEDMSVSAFHDDTPGFERDFVVRNIAFYDSETFLRQADGRLRKLDVPLDAEVSVDREWLLVSLRSDWSLGSVTHPAGALLAARFDDFLAGERAFETLFTPTPRRSLEGFSVTRNHLILNVLDDVKNELSLLTPGPGGWARAPLEGAPALVSISADSLDPDESDDYFLTVSGYLTPTSLLYGRIGGPPPVLLKQLPAFFEASGLVVTQHFATSKDGTRVPYFQVARRDLALDGQNPTLLYGYGGFEISLTPGYGATVGTAWLARGGVYVVANIRGGGEYGPAWHQAGLRQKRPRVYEDFAAVAQDLIARQVTSPARLGAQGGSNGGLLVGNMITGYPELFGAIVCQVPLLDMKRYRHLLAGASWMAEYGDPDNPEEWAFIEGFSAYHNVRPGRRYPPVLFMTSTRDDRVHPGHARKMMAKMEALGCDVRYYENIEGGHGGAANNRQAAHMSALAYAFLWERLGNGLSVPGLTNVEP